MSIFSKAYKRAKKSWDRSDAGKAGGAAVKTVQKTAEQIKAEADARFKKAYDSLSSEGKKAYDTAHATAMANIKKIRESIKRSDFATGVDMFKKGVSKKVELAKDTVKRSDLGSGAVEKSVKRSDWGRASRRFNRGAQGTYRGMTNSIYQAGRQATKAKESFGRAMYNRYRAMSRQARAARDHVGKQLSSDTVRNFSLKRSIRGTASGASQMYRRSDAGRTMRYLGRRTGYTGSDFDRGMRKVEREGANVVNQVTDTIDSPGKVIMSNIKKADQYVKDRLGVNVPTSQELLNKGIQAVGDSLRPKGKPSVSTNIGGPGGGQTIGQGSMEGLQGGGQLAASQRSRTRQNKRKLRIARA